MPEEEDEAGGGGRSLWESIRRQDRRMGQQAVHALAETALLPATLAQGSSFLRGKIEGREPGYYKPMFADFAESVRARTQPPPPSDDLADKAFTSTASALTIAGTSAVGMGALAARYTPQMASKLTRSILEPFRQQPVKALGVEAIAGMGSEAGAEVASRYFPESFPAQIVGSLLGGMEAAGPFASRLNRAMDPEFAPIPRVESQYDQDLPYRQDAAASVRQAAVPTQPIHPEDEVLRPWMDAAQQQAYRPGGRVREMTLPNSSDEIKRLLEVSQEEFAGQARRLVSREETQSLADLLGTTVEDVISGNAKNANIAYDSVRMQKAMNLLHSSTEQVGDLARRHRENPTSASRGEFIEAITRNRLIQETVSTASSEAGRTLNVLRGYKNKNAKIQAKALQKLVDKAGGAKSVDRMIDLMDGKTPEEIAAVSRVLGKVPNWSDKALEVWINWNLLSGPQTTGVNLTGNALFQATQQMIVRPAAALRGLAHGDPKRIQFRELASEMYGSISNIPLAFRNAGRAWRTEDEGFALMTNPLTKEGADPRRKRFSGLGEGEFRRFEALKEGQLEGVAPAIGGRAGRLARVPGRALQSQDEFFKTLAMQGRLRGAAMRRVMDEGIDPKDWDQTLEAYSKNPLAKDLVDAQAHSRRMTFTQDLGPTGKTVQNAINAHPTFKFVVPFFRTPMNLAKENIHLMPGLSPKMRGMFKEGGKSRDLAVAQWYTGAGLMAWAAGLAEEGKLHGSMPDDQAERTLAYAEGRKPNSILMGGDEENGSWVNVSRLQPFGSLMGLTANFYHAVKRGDITSEQWQKAGPFLVSAFADHIGSQTALQGSSKFFAAYDNPKQNFDRYIEQTMGSVSSPAIAAQTARALDPTLRDSRGYSEADEGLLKQLRGELGPAVAARLPFLRETLPPVYDILGRKERTGAKTGGPVARLVNPLYISPAKATPLTRLMNKVGANIAAPSRSIKIPVGELPEEAEINLRRPLMIEMSPAEYSKFSRRAGQTADLWLKDRVENLGAESDVSPDLVREDIEADFLEVRELLREEMIQKWYESGKISREADRQLKSEARVLKGRQN